MSPFLRTHRAPQPARSAPATSDTRSALRWLLVTAFVVGGLLRVFRVVNIPPGLYRDEAFTGMDALATLREGPRVFYTSAFGREPLFTWLVAASIEVWGATPLAVRLPSVVVGCLTLVTLYLAARELWSARVAVFATAVLAVTLWHVLFSRLGFRAILVPLVSSVGVWATARGAKSGRYLWWTLGGAAAGLLLYTYVAARAAIIPAVAMLAYAWWRRSEGGFPSLLELMTFSVTALMVMAPLLVYMVTNYADVMRRTANVASIFNSELPWTMLWENLRGILGMFFIRGDYLPRHNLPFRPVFDPVLGVVFVIGCGVVLWRFTRSYAAAFLLLWTAGMLLPTLVTEKAPHFVRAIGVLPFVAVFPALGLDCVWRLLVQRSQRLARLGVGLCLSVGLVSTGWAYFVRYPEVEDLCYRFECAGTDFASDVNTYLDQGWTSDAWLAQPGPPRQDRQVFVQHQLWKDLVNAHYLIPDTGGFNVPGDGEVISRAPDADLPMLYYGWLNSDYPRYWEADMRAWLPPASRITLREGPMIVTEQDKSPHPAYLRFAAEPSALPGSRLADLDHDISLVDGCIVQTKTGIRVQLIWYAGQPAPVDFTAFVHYERDGQIIAQSDAQPGLGYYPMTAWRSGDQFVDRHDVVVPASLPGDRIYAGLYFYATGERVPVLSSTTVHANDRIMLDVQACDPQAAVQP